MLQAIFPLCSNLRTSQAQCFAATPAGQRCGREGSAFNPRRSRYAQCVVRPLHPSPVHRPTRRVGSVHISGKLIRFSSSGVATAASVSVDPGLPSSLALSVNA